LRGIGALGYTIQRPTEDRFLMTEEELDNRMAVLLGGRAAECIFFHHLSTGAADDLVKATDTARSMVLRYGMDKDLGHVAYERERPPILGVPAQPNPYAREFSDETESADGSCHPRAGRSGFRPSDRDSQRSPISA
jgi:cell division protease FtsH